MREFDGGVGRWDAFRDLPDLFEGLVEALAFSQRPADPIVAAENAGRSGEEVTYPAEAHKRFDLCAERYSEECHFVQAAGNDRALGVVAETQPIAHAGADRHDVLEGAAKLDAYEIRACVYAKATCCEALPHPFCASPVLRRDDRGRWDASSKLYGEIWTAQYTNVCSGPFFEYDFAHSLGSVRLQPLSRDDDKRICR